MMLKVRNLSARIGDRRILDGVSFDLEPGAALALMGPNGAGKTTLLRCLLGLVRFSGSAEIDGFDVATQGVAARRSLGYVPQAPAFYDMNAGDWLRFVARLRRVPASQVPLALDRVGLQAEAGRPVRVFSGGMQQRLSVAAALLGNPPLILLDEPTANLDPAGRSDLLRLLHAFRDEGKTLVLSSHRAAEVTDLADRVLGLNGGIVESYGPPSDVMPPDRLRLEIEAHESVEKRRLGCLLSYLDLPLVTSLNGSVNTVVDSGRVIPILDRLRSEGVPADRIRLRPFEDGAGR